MAQDTNTLSGWDYVVFILVLGVSAGIGIFYGCTGGKQKTTKEFLMADRSMSVLPVTLSLLASFMSAITLLGTPAEIYVYGTQYWMIWLGYCIMIPLCAHCYHPVFFKLKLTSMFEYLELRFSRGVRIIGAGIYILQMVLYLAIVLYAPSLALNAVTGFNVWAAVLSVGIVCTFYTTLGGMKAVMWTDVFQICMMFAGLMAVLIKGSIDHGGFKQIWRYMDEGERIEFFNFDPDPMVRHSFWTLSFGGAFTWLSIYGVNQSQVQRSMTLPTLREAKIAIWLNLVGLTALLTICSLCGMVVYAEYRDCDPLSPSVDRIKGMDQLLPLYVMDRLTTPGIPGLFTACLFSGGLSTISSGLNSLSAVTLQDLVRNIWFKDMDEERATTVSKCLAFGYGVIMIALTFVAAQLGGVLQAALALFGMLGGPILGLYTLGIIFPWCNTKGAYAGLGTGLLFTMWLGIGAQIHKPAAHKAPVSVAGCPIDNQTFLADMSPLMSHATTMETPPPESGYGSSFYDISYLYYSACAVLVVTVVGLLVSFITGPNKPEDVDPKLLSPVLYDLFCCVPPSIRSALRCNIRYVDDEPAETEQDDVVLQKEKGSIENFAYVNPAATASIDVPPWRDPEFQYETNL